MTEEALDEALREMWNKPAYADKSFKISVKTFSSPTNELKENCCLLDIEYIVRNGAKFLCSPTLDLHWWQLELLDVKFLYLYLSENFPVRPQIATYRILGVIPWPLKSHNMIFQTLLKSLAKRGHQVDVISYYELENAPKNYTTVIKIGELNLDNKVNFDSIEEAVNCFNDAIGYLSKKKIGRSFCKILAHEKMQQLLRNPPKDPPYDLIIIESEGVSCLYGLGPFFKVPLITLTPSQEFPWISRTVGNPLSTAFFPTHLLKISKIRTFWDRLVNTLRSMVDIYRYYKVTEDQLELVQKYLIKDILTIREIENMVALTLINTHHTIQGVRPTTPAFIEVGGMHIEEETTKFTEEFKEIKQWMDESKSGVIYMSLGTVIAIENMPKKTILSIYSTFSKFAPIRFLIKGTEGFKFPPGLPKNVMTKTWIPQIPVLCHNNTRAFITHGGVHSIQEIFYCGIPAIGIPIFADQYQNVNILIKKNMGIKLNFEKITEKILNEALTKILNDPKFSEAAKYNSKLFRDRPMSPMDTAIYWIEYVVRNGAKSLRSPAVDMYWWQVDLLDVYGFLLLCFMLTFYLSFIFVKIVKKFICKKVKLELKRD